MTTRRWTGILGVVGVLPGVLVAGCAGAEGEGPVGSAVAAIMSVPTGVQCVRLSVRGVTRNFTVTAGASATLDLGPLAPGALTVSGQGFDVACASVTTSTVASWVGDAVTITVAAGYTADVALTLRPNARTTARVDFTTPARSIAAASNGTFAIMQDGTVRAWGNNEFGQVGDGTTTNRRTPVRVAGLVGVRQIAPGGSHACALLDDGRAFCWGDNSTGQFGNGTTTGSATPVAAAGALRFTQLAAGSGFTCGVTTDPPSVYCWGDGTYGQLGNGTNESTLTPTPRWAIPSVGVEVVANEFSSCDRGADGQTYCTGNNTGHFGEGSSDRYTRLVPSGYALGTIVQLGVSHSCGLRFDGTLRCAGNNSGGMLGDGTDTGRTTTAPVLGISNVTQVALGGSSTCARRGDGTVWCWGNNDYGQLGAGDTTRSLLPQQVPALAGVTQVAAGGAHTCALRSDGSVWCWGNNYYGAIGDGSYETRFIPVQARL